MTTALARGRWDGQQLVDVRDIFVADAYGEVGAAASRIIFGQDGMIYMTVGGVFDERAQNPSSHSGKVVRLRDDGTGAPDDPMIGKTGFKPEIFSLGHRNGLGLAIHPQSGQIWEAEQGPNGGDEINVLLPGRNYGWPVVSYGHNYNGANIGSHAWKEGIEEPLLIWVPSIAVSGMTFYTGNKFPAWEGNVFVGSLQAGEIPGTGHLERIVLNEKSEELRRESLLVELKQRIRDVRQGPDGLLYLITDADQGALIRLEPVEEVSAKR
jgi:glucose/arabinose dehydrogenase